jgi:hypothetical protein
MMTPVNVLILAVLVAWIIGRDDSSSGRGT